MSIVRVQGTKNHLVKREKRFISFSCNKSLISTSASQLGHQSLINICSDVYLPSLLLWQLNIYQTWPWSGSSVNKASFWRSRVGATLLTPQGSRIKLILAVPSVRQVNIEMSARIRNVGKIIFWNSLGVSKLILSSPIGKSVNWPRFDLSFCDLGEVLLPETGRETLLDGA